MPLGFSQLGSTPIGASADANQDAIPVPIPVVTGVIVTPVDAILEGGASQQYFAQVAGFNQSQDVTWSAKLAIINQQGIATLPAALASDQEGTITATSKDDPTQSGSAQFTIKGTALPDPDPGPIDPPIDTSGAPNIFASTILSDDGIYLSTVLL